MAVGRRVAEGWAKPGLQPQRGRGRWHSRWRRQCGRARCGLERATRTSPFQAPCRRRRARAAPPCRAPCHSRGPPWPPADTTAAGDCSVSVLARGAMKGGADGGGLSSNADLSARGCWPRQWTLPCAVACCAAEGECPRSSRGKRSGARELAWKTGCFSAPIKSGQTCRLRACCAVLTVRERWRRGGLVGQLRVDESAAAPADTADVHACRTCMCAGACHAGAAARWPHATVPAAETKDRQDWIDQPQQGGRRAAW